MVAVFVTPLMVAWAEFGGNAPQSVRTYRLFLTVAVMLVMGVLVFLKQHLLDRELLSLLRLSRHNLDEMCRMKDELENKEHSLRWHGLELQRKNLELQEISFTDVLTGIWNRRYLEEILTAEAQQVLRNYQRARGSDIRKMDHRDLVFIMVDMDFFKEVNDLHGHPAGDRLLQLVAQRLSTVVRKSDVLVRWGGEEFLIMSRSTDPSGTPAFCSRILEVMRSGTLRPWPRHHTSARPVRWDGLLIPGAAAPTRRLCARNLSRWLTPRCTAPRLWEEIKAWVSCATDAASENPARC